MSTRNSNPCAAPGLHTALDEGLVALGALVAVGVMVLFLALAGANRASPASSVTPTHPSTAHVTLIQPRGTAAPPTTIHIPATPARGAEHPEPAVPQSTHHKRPQQWGALRSPKPYCGPGRPIAA
jgi:hypothetical protein